MDLPFAIAAGRSSERLVSVDGAWDQPGLNLSHWPGNTTPAELRADLSTGIALAFARLPHGRRTELADGCRAIVNNHFDTDGVCAMFAVRRPQAALERERRLLDTAAAGDFFQVPNEEAFCLDATISNLADPERSSWSELLRGLDDRERHEAVVRELVERLPGMLDGNLEDYADLWKPELEELREGRAALSAADKSEVVHLDLCVWEGARGARFAPGRHALFGSTRADRVLAVGRSSLSNGGTSYRFLLSTLSWFNLVTRSSLPRPDLAALCARLNESEGTDPSAEVAWRCQESASPSPELWFGTADLDDFAETSAALRGSRLESAFVRAAVADALRETWAFPE